MCGLAGFAGVSDYRNRLALVWGLGMGIDGRGRDAAGFVSVSDSRVTYRKTPGLWIDASEAFMHAAAEGNRVCMMHARFATCGRDRRSVDEAHPFAIRRNGHVKLWGAHNGQIWNARESAKRNRRPYRVDSEELFQLLADDDVAAIQDLDGYGVITWVEPSKPHVVKLAKLSSHADIHVASLVGGGIVWGSTETIVAEALDFADMRAESVIDIADVGQVYEIREDWVYTTNRDGIRFDPKPSYSPSADDYWAEAWARWEAEAADDAEERELMRLEAMAEQMGGE